MNVYVMNNIYADDTATLASNVSELNDLIKFVKYALDIIEGFISIYKDQVHDSKKKE